MATTAPRDTRRETTPTVRFDRILCAIDFSDFSPRTVKDAVAVARASKGEITALFVFPLVPLPPPDVSSAKPVEIDPGARSVVAKDIEALLEPARRAGVSWRIRMRAGDPAIEILAQAREDRSDVIVMGTHGRSGLKRWVLGSVTDRVLRQSACPVLATVHPEPSALPASGGGITSIVCAVDLTPSSATTFEYALSLGRLADVPLTVVHVLEDGGGEDALAFYGASNRSLAAETEAAARLHELVPEDERASGRVREMVATGRRYREILRHADEPAGVVVIGSHGPDAVFRPFCGTTTDRVVRGAACAVLTVPAASGTPA
jgi:nucleotide-binding universal stress UspA family protein